MHVRNPDQARLSLPHRGDPQSRELGLLERRSLATRVGYDSGETTRTFLDEDCFFPILVQHLQPVGLDPAGGLAGPGGDGMGGADRGGSARPKGGVGAMDQGGYLLELFGSDL
jgi:hypothetical protein